LYVPSLKECIAESKVPDEVRFIPEIVINGISLDRVKHAMKASIKAVKDMNGVVRISAGNYDGKLGKHRIYLRELL
jgi:formylmethanofuran--tetrahydromethanopterin N-formyltransferase